MLKNIERLQRTLNKKQRKKIECRNGRRIKKVREGDIN